MNLLCCLGIRVICLGLELYLESCSLDLYGFGLILGLECLGLDLYGFGLVWFFPICVFLFVLLVGSLYVCFLYVPYNEPIGMSPIRVFFYICSL